MHGARLRVQNLGELIGDLLLFGGPYSNLQASQAMLAVAQRADILPANRICTGDLVAYCASPVLTLRLWQDQCVLVAGNCEKQLGAGAVDCGCGFEAGSACVQLSKDWYPYARAALCDNDRMFLASAPDLVVFEHCGKRYAVLHGGLHEVARYLWPVSAGAEIDQEIEAVRDLIGPVNCVIAGHCGLAFQRRVGGVDWVNVGAIGMPPHDGTPATRYGVLTRAGIQPHRLSYDHRGARRAMEKAGLGQGYGCALGTGYWPSEDILPVSLRRASALANG